MTKDEKLNLFLDSILSQGDGSSPAEAAGPGENSIPIEHIHPFPQHPYKVEDNEEMEALTESIRDQGILTPLLVRCMDGSETEYEVISGHRRLHAAGRAGLNSVPVHIVAMDRNTAAIALVDSNLHRERLLPSEKAFAYRMKMEALEHRGQRCGQVGHKSRDQISDTESGRQVQRYIRLTRLIPELLERMDAGGMALSVGVELSYLDETAQRQVFNAMGINDCTPSYSQAVRLHKAFTERSLEQEQIERVLAEEKPNQKEQIRLKRNDYARFIPSHYTAAQIEQDIRKGLELLYRQRQRDRDAR